MARRKLSVRRLASAGIAGAFIGVFGTAIAVSVTTVEWDAKITVRTQGKWPPQLAQKGKPSKSSGSAGYTEYVYLTEPFADEPNVQGRKSGDIDYNDPRQQLLRKPGKQRGFLDGGYKLGSYDGGHGLGSYDGGYDPYSYGDTPTQPDRKSSVKPPFNFSWDIASATFDRTYSDSTIKPVTDYGGGGFVDEWSEPVPDRRSFKHPFEVQLAEYDLGGGWVYKEGGYDLGGGSDFGSDRRSGREWLGRYG